MVMHRPALSVCRVTILVAMLAGHARAAESAALPLDPELPYQAQRLNPVTYKIDFSVVVTPPYKTKVLRVWLPIPPSDVAQEVSDSRLSSFPLRVEPQIAAEPVYGNRFACFEFHNPQGAQIIRHKFSAKVWELRWQLDPAKLAAVDQWPSSFDRYRRGDTQAVVVDDRFRALRDQIVPQHANPLADLDRLMRWVEQNFTYDHVDASLRASAEHGLTRHRGHCSDYHSFCASMGRAMGFPMRIAYGINTFAKNSPSHCKLEAYLPPYGWVSFDVSETQKLIADIRQQPLDERTKDRLAQAAQQRLMAGFRDNTWLLQTRGTDYDLAPKASRRVPVVRTAYIEADGEPLPEPDPANKQQRAFSWMTVHDYVPDRPVTYPFTDLTSLDVRPQE
jgi:transglutaminase-like putative cysteine protease